MKLSIQTRWNFFYFFFHSLHYFLSLLLSSLHFSPFKHSYFSLGEDIYDASVLVLMCHIYTTLCLIKKIFIINDFIFRWRRSETNFIIRELHMLRVSSIKFTCYSQSQRKILISILDLHSTEDKRLAQIQSN